MMKPGKGNEKDYPKFDPEGSKYNLQEYWGRVKAFIDVIDPRTLLASDKDIQHAQDLLRKYDEGALPPDVTDKDLWESKKLKDAVIHPSTGKKIPAPLRMSSFVFMNVPLVAGMLSATTTPSIIFWQFSNQSYNSAMNYANRSGAEVDTSKLLKSYAVAVSTSLGIALGLRHLGSHGPKLFQRVAKQRFTIPFLAVSGAGAANIYATRSTEIAEGVAVTDAKGREVGTSQKAAKKAVYQTIWSRAVILAVPVIVFPPLLMKAVPKTLPKPVLLGSEVVSIAMCISGALPLAIAVFPQKLELDPKKLEKDFHHLKDEDGKPVEKLYTNKGL